jgi:hypothetical protein
MTAGPSNLDTTVDAFELTKGGYVRDLLQEKRTGCSLPMYTITQTEQDDR